MPKVREKSLITVVGIGADGLAGLSESARAAISGAEVVFGGPRQLAYLPESAPKVPWPSPLLPALDGLLAEHAGRRVCVLASGDPLLSGIGTTLVKRLGSRGWTVGGGIETLFAPNWSFKVEYLYVDFGNKVMFNVAPGVPEWVSVRTNVVRVGINYQSR